MIFPPTYRAFLQHLGCGGVKGEEFYGIPKSGLTSPSVPNSIWVTLKERKDANLPQSVIIVANNGVGGWYLSTLKRNADGDSPVVDWWPNNLPSQVVAEDFEHFSFNACIRRLDERSLVASSGESRVGEVRGSKGTGHILGRVSGRGKILTIPGAANGREPGGLLPDATRTQPVPLCRQ